jgi:hypothetical protein
MPDADALDARSQAPSSIPLGFGDVTGTVGDHIAHFFRGPDQRFSVLGPYVETGLRRGDRCVFISDPDTGSGLCDWLRERDVDVEDARGAGRLVLHPGRDTEADMKELADRIDAEARDDEEPFVRWAGDGEWALDRESRSAKCCAGRPSTTSTRPAGACWHSASSTSPSSRATS